MWQFLYYSGDFLFCAGDFQKTKIGNLHNNASQVRNELKLEIRKVSETDYFLKSALPFDRKNQDLRDLWRFSIKTQAAEVHD